MLRVSEEEEGNRKRESYVESYRQLGRTLLDLQHAADRIFDAIAQRVAEERSKLTDISRRIQSAKAQIDVLAHSEQASTIKSPSRYPSNCVQDFRPLFSYHDEDADEGFSVSNLLVNGGLNREFGAYGTLELFQFFSEENIGYPIMQTQKKDGSKFGYPRQDAYLEKVLEAPKYIDDSFIALDSSVSLLNLEGKKDKLPPPPPSLLKNFTVRLCMKNGRLGIIILGAMMLSFDVLAGDSSGDEHSLLPAVHSNPILANGDGGRALRRRRKSRAAKKNKRMVERAASEDLNPPTELVDEKPSVVENGYFHDSIGIKVLENRSVVETVCEGTVVETVCEDTVVEAECDSSRVSCVSFAELRQRNVNGSAAEEPGEEAKSTRENSAGQRKPESNVGVNNLATAESLDWNQVMAQDPNLLGEVSFVDRSPFKYFVGEIYSGSSLRGTISAGNEKKRQRVYNTMFHVPWRCERLIVAGFFVCLESFLSLLTIMPAKIAMAVWRVLKTRQFWMPSAAELSDFGCFFVLASGVASLHLTDISLIYHFIRGQGTIKLYVVYNVLEIFDKLCQSFGEDVLQVLFDSAEGLAACSPENLKFELIRFIFDEAIAAITLSTCIIAHNNAVLALLVSNNFAEIKSNVFKRVSKENIHSLVYYDIVERFHITAFVLFVLAQNILEAEGPWFESFFCNALMVFMCEVFVDAIKHSFLAKFNEIKPIAYSEFLEDLCAQTLNEKTDERRKDLTFIPLAPACVVIRVLTPVYASILPSGPLPWRLLWIFFWSSLTYVMLAIWKIMVGLSLRRLATWYINLRHERKQHMD
ncbi:protein POLLEN DEFECTIVE IN GUIDANCE 1 [Canna indica]|uniref:Protein POLLEN DEFECTIVE IN GUIDANCE 1 n=1 Tax=Canna indica TaxID=4628 RepID=A0AAQ3K9Z9_9LILI|nr:protein POLLEN DEFECTIVE IN GUIDANCE 1 [Canna indica]